MEWSHNRRVQLVLSDSSDLCGLEGPLFDSCTKPFFSFHFIFKIIHFPRNLLTFWLHTLGQGVDCKLQLLKR